MFGVAPSMPNNRSMVPSNRPMMGQQQRSRHTKNASVPTLSATVTSKEFSFVDALSFGGNGKGSPTKMKNNKPSKDSPRATTPPMIFWPKAGPSTATRVTIKKPESLRPATAPKSPKEARVAAIKKALEQCLETSHRATKIGDKVSIRMMEYLTSVEQPPHSLHALAHGFLDSCKQLLEVEAGLAAAVSIDMLLRAESVEEVEGCVKKAVADFVSIDSLLGKSIEYQKKGTVGRKITLGWGKGCSNKDFDRQLTALVVTRLELRDAVDGLPWEDTATNLIPSGKGIGYTGLAAALNRLVAIASSPTTSPSVARVSACPSTLFLNLNKNTTAGTKPLSTDLRLNSAHGRLELPTGPLPSLPPQKTPSLNKDAATIDSRYSMTTSGASSAYHQSLLSGGDGSYLYDSDTDEFTDYTPEITSPNVVRIKVDPATIPRSVAKHVVDPFARASHHESLLSAIRLKNRKLVEKLLSRGVLPGASKDSHPLNEAIAIHDDDIVRQLLLFGANPNEPDKNGITPLLAAINESQLSSAVNLLKHGADPHLAAGSESESPLARAVRLNATGFTHCLLIYGGSVRHMTSKGETLLISAINPKTPQMVVEILLDYGADPNGKTKDGRTALHEAIFLGRVDLMAVLLDKGASPNLPGPNHMLWTAVDNLNCLPMLLAAGADPKRAPGILEFATRANNVEAVRLLLKSKADPDAKSGIDTPLCTAIRDNRQEIFQLLVNSGADPNVKADMHPTTKCVMLHRAHFLPALKAAGADLKNPKGLLETAAAFKNMDALKWLLESNVDPNEKSTRGYTALTTAIRDNRLDMVNLLLAHGADPNVRGQDWPLCMAVKNPAILKRVLKTTEEPRAFRGVMEMAVSANKLDSVKMLLKAGVSPEDKTAGAYSPLTTAIREGRPQMVQYLVADAKANVNAPGEHLPLVMAVKTFNSQFYGNGGAGDVEILETLLERGANPNVRYRGWNAAMQAVDKGDLSVLKMICEQSRHGVDWRVEDERGRSVMELAMAKGWGEAVAILMKSAVADRRR